MLTQSKDITEAFVTYYQKLYTEEIQPHIKEKIEFFHSWINLTVDEAGLMTRRIAEEEIKENILIHNKSPGVNCFPVEY